MPEQSVIIPRDLWVEILNITRSMDECKNILKRIGVELPDMSPEAEVRREKIIEIAKGMPWVDSDGKVEIDSDARLSECDVDGCYSNGCYVSAWVWCSFSDTEFEKLTYTDSEEDTEDDH